MCVCVCVRVCVCLMCIAIFGTPWVEPFVETDYNINFNDMHARVLTLKGGKPNNTVIYSMHFLKK